VESSERVLPATEDCSVDALLAEIQPRLVRILGAFRIPAADAEDLIQDVLLAFVLKRPSIVSPSAWLAEALRVRCREYLRTQVRRRTQELHEATYAAPDSAFEDRSNRHLDVTRSLAKLPPRSREVLRLRFWEGMTQKEIAQTSGYALTSLDKTGQRALAVVRRRLRTTHSAS